MVIVFFCSMTLTLDNIAGDMCLRYTGNRKKLVLSWGGNNLIIFGSLRFSLCIGYLRLTFSIMPKSL